MDSTICISSKLWHTTRISSKRYDFWFVQIKASNGLCRNKTQLMENFFVMYRFLSIVVSFYIVMLICPMFSASFDRFDFPFWWTFFPSLTAYLFFCTTDVLSNSHISNSVLFFSLALMEELLSFTHSAHLYQHCHALPQLSYPAGVW